MTGAAWWGRGRDSFTLGQLWLQITQEVKSSILPSKLWGVVCQGIILQVGDTGDTYFCEIFENVHIYTVSWAQSNF